MNWLLMMVLLILILLTFMGFHKGLVRMAVSLLAMVLALLLTFLLTGYVTDFLKNRTGLYTSIESRLEESIGGQLEERLEALTVAGQVQFIENLPLPESLRDRLLENNNSEIYHTLGVDTFARYISSYLASLVVGVIGFIVTFLLSWVILKLVLRLLDLVTKLPLIHGINKIAGALLGLAEGLVIVWLLFMAVTLVPGTAFGQNASQMIVQSHILTYLYDHNLFLSYLLGLVGKA